MSEPKRFPGLPAELWRKLASAQDAAVSDASTATPVALAAAGRTPVDEEPRRARARGLRRWLPAGAGLAFGTLAATAAVVFLWMPLHGHRRVPVVQQASLNEVNRVSQTVETDASRSSPLQFSDGSRVTFGPGSAGRMQRLTEARVELTLDHGRIDAHVIHAASTLWLIHAGPFEVRVTGTRFSVTWSAPRLLVEVYEGEVKVGESGVGGAAPRSSVALRAGHRLTAGHGLMLTEALATVSTAGGGDVSPEAAGPPAMTAPGAVGPSPPSPSPTGMGAGASSSSSPSPSPATSARPGEWVVMAQRGAYAQAYATASHLGWRSLCARLDARRLLLLGDVARYASAGDEARRAFESLVARFPDDHLAADAEFTLGRLAFEAEQTVDATRWFERYVTDWPTAPLAEQALGRLVECAVRSNDVAVARRAARRYLLRAPHGPHAELARDVLERASHGSP